MFTFELFTQNNTEFRDEKGNLSFFFCFQSFCASLISEELKQEKMESTPHLMELVDSSNLRHVWNDCIHASECFLVKTGKLMYDDSLECQRSKLDYVVQSLVHTMIASQLLRDVFVPVYIKCCNTSLWNPLIAHYAFSRSEVIYNYRIVRVFNTYEFVTCVTSTYAHYTVFDIVVHLLLHKPVLQSTTSTINQKRGQHHLSALVNLMSFSSSESISSNFTDHADVCPMVHLSSPDHNNDPLTCEYQKTIIDVFNDIRHSLLLHPVKRKLYPVPEPITTYERLTELEYEPFNLITEIEIEAEHATAIALQEEASFASVASAECTVDIPVVCPEHLLDEFELSLDCDDDICGWDVCMEAVHSTCRDDVQSALSLNSFFDESEHEIEDNLIDRMMSSLSIQCTSRNLESSLSLSSVSSVMFHFQPIECC
jgi:hypothetical protein